MKRDVLVFVVGLTAGALWILTGLMGGLGLSWPGVTLGTVLIVAWSFVWRQPASGRQWPAVVAGQWASISLAVAIATMARGEPFSWPVAGWSAVMGAWLMALWMIPVAIALVATSRRTA